MSYEFYKCLHLVSVVAVFLTLGGIGVQYVLCEGSKSSVHRPLMIGNGIALLLLLVSGFGLIAKLGLSSFPAWIYVKLGAWLGLGAYAAVCRRLHARFGLVLSGALGLGLIAVVAAVTKMG